MSKPINFGTKVHFIFLKQAPVTMAKFYDGLTPALTEFIKGQHIFFVATALQEGRINLSPKGMDSFRVLSPTQIVWLNLTGSGNETAAHLLEYPRMTIMFCAFEGKPLILRLYGQARAYHERDPEYQTHIERFETNAGARQIIIMNIESVQTSCGYAVPLMEFQEERTILSQWATKKGRDGIKQYWADKNTISIDGQETQILGDAPTE